MEPKSKHKNKNTKLIEKEIRLVVARGGSLEEGKLKEGGWFAVWYVGKLKVNPKSSHHESFFVFVLFFTVSKWENDVN